MEADALRRLIRKGENETLDFKEDLSTSFYKAISAFANTRGGTILLGVGNKGNIVGFDTKRETLRDLTNSIMNRTGIQPSVEVVDVDRKKVLTVKVPSSKVPISFEGRFYKRVGSNTVELKPESLSKFFLEKSGLTWDSLPCDAGFKNIDQVTVKLFKSYAKERISTISEADSIEKVFTNMELVTEEGKITRAGLLLFGKEPDRFFISAKTRVGRFKGLTTILDTVIAEGNLFSQLEKTVEAIQKHLNVRFDIKGIERRDVWDYPIEAIREAVTNAIIHKDYSSTAEIQIKVFDDKIWIWNPGELPEELRIEDLKREHSSYPRNPLIANVFYLAGFIERWGSGTKRIVDLCKEQGLPEPDYKEEQGGFSVWFYKDIFSEENLRKLGLNERQIKAVMHVKERGKITNKEYRGMFGITDRSALRDLTGICEKGIFQKVGRTGRGTEYVITRHKPDKPATNPT